MDASIGTSSSMRDSATRFFTLAGAFTFFGDEDMFSLLDYGRGGRRRSRVPESHLGTAMVSTDISDASSA